MKKTLLFTPLAMLLGASLAHANSGNMAFEGRINAATCIVTPGAGAGGGAGNIAVDLGTVALTDVGSGSTIGSGSSSFSLNVNCADGVAGLDTVHMSFDPRSGSGMDPDAPALLQIANAGAADSAVGVGIGLFDATDTLLALNANGVITAPLTVDGAGAGTATMQVKAGYMFNTVASPRGGAADGVLPFTLKYE